MGMWAISPSSSLTVAQARWCPAALTHPLVMGSPMDTSHRCRRAPSLDTSLPCTEKWWELGTNARVQYKKKKCVYCRSQSVQYGKRKSQSLFWQILWLWYESGLVVKWSLLPHNFSQVKQNHDDVTFVWFLRPGHLCSTTVLHYTSTVTSIVFIESLPLLKIWILHLAILYFFF